jgi:hypothetical protein
MAGFRYATVTGFERVKLFAYNHARRFILKFHTSEKRDKTKY